jgi:two-component system, OmpR family, sensor histidine kinase KdpD
MLRLRSLTLPRPTRPAPFGLVLAVVLLALATLMTAVLQGAFGVPNAAIVYLLPVVAVGTGYGSWLAIGTAFASFLLYDYLFTQPLYTFAIAAPEEWLDLLLFLVVAIAIGRLSALQLQRRREADLRTAEARAMFSMSRDIATAATALEAAPLLAARLMREAAMARVWIGLGLSIAEERVVADSASGIPRPLVTSRWLLHSSSADAQPSWTRVRDVLVARPRPRAAGEAAVAPARLGEARDGEGPLIVFRVPIQAGAESIGSLWATRKRSDPFPGRSHSRLLAAAADQFGQAVVRDRLAAEATTAEVARQSDALKSALIDSVSHDLRTPLAAIRAAAGNLMDPDVDWPREEWRSAARSIDAEAQRLSRLVRNMLDLGRIEGGALRPLLELYDLADLVDPLVERLRPQVLPATVEVAIPEDLPAVRIDAGLADHILTNLFENAARYAPGQRIRVSAAPVGESRVELVVEDAGPGVPATALPRLFERFYRVPRRSGIRDNGGSGIGLAVVRGLAEAMGGLAEARPSELGGLAVAVTLPAETVEEEMEEGIEGPAGTEAPDLAEAAEAAGAAGAEAAGAEVASAAEAATRETAAPVASKEPAR